jgi:hypothetical protein
MGVRQDKALYSSWPFLLMITEHEPQAPWLHETFVPVSLSRSRRKDERGVRLDSSLGTAWVTPFTDRKRGIGGHPSLDIVTNF